MSGLGIRITIITFSTSINLTLTDICIIIGLCKTTNLGF